MAQSAPVSHWAGCDRHARRSSAGGSRSANDKPLPGHKRYPLHAVFSHNTMTTAAPESPPKTLYMPIGDSAESPEKPRHVPRNRRRGLADRHTFGRPHIGIGPSDVSFREQSG